MRELYVATGNAGKLRDFAAAALAFGVGADWKIRPLPGLEAMAAPAEDAKTFEGNARAKAIYYSLLAPGALVVADDSGLEVEALGGAPGVYSARYAAQAGAAPAEMALDDANNQHLLSELAGTPVPAGLLASQDPRAARYRCVLAAAQDGMCVCVAEGSLEGRILREPRGEGGFGYDPLFYLPGLEQTMAELDASTRITVSHRGKALKALLTKLAVTRHD